MTTLSGSAPARVAAPAASTFARLAQLAAAPAAGKMDDKDRRIAALEAENAALKARAAKDDDTDDDDTSDDDTTPPKKQKKKTKNPKDDGQDAEEEDPPIKDKDKNVKDDGEDASITTTGSIIPYSADKMKADKATAAAIIAAGNRRRGEKD